MILANDNAAVPVLIESLPHVTAMQACAGENLLLRLADGRERLPAVRVVFSILAGGCPFLLERLSQRGVEVRSALDPGVFFDTSVWSPIDLIDVYNRVSPEHLLYASDYPYGQQPSSLLIALRVASVVGLA